MCITYVGYDQPHEGDVHQSMWSDNILRSLRRQEFAKEGLLKTEGLCNCIAIVAYDINGKGAVLRHFDTLSLITGCAESLSDSDKFMEYRRIFLEVKAQTLTFLRQFVGDASAAYAIALGTSWKKPEFLKPYRVLIRRVFGNQIAQSRPPGKYGSGTATWDIANKCFTD